ncbi:MAG: ABC transporter ATP-binding protein [Alicyclobacillus sp.]|nr:ABC transporter ATP-binding protein [Alicyclobacillus sp.]
MTALCDIRNLSVTYFGDPEVTAVKNVSLTIGQGEIVGLAGESGCGKSTLVMALTQLLDNGEIRSGEIWFEGLNLVRLREADLKELRWAKMSLVTQSAMSALNPVLRVGDQIADAILAHTGVGRRAAWARVRELLRTVEVDPDRARSYPHELSGGMRQRVMIAMALALQPSLVIMDEPTTALDVVVQKQIIQKVKELQVTHGFSVLFITHDMSLLLAIADKIAIMYAGEIVEMGTRQDILQNPKHPYTMGLLNSFPSVFEKRPLTGIGGSPPSMVSPPSGCRFHTRCPHVMERCQSQTPSSVTLSDTHWAACHLLPEVNVNA